MKPAEIKQSKQQVGQQGRKICVVTGTRADYGLLYWLIKEVHDDPLLELQLVVTGMHLSPEYGSTYKQIEDDGFSIARKVEVLLSSDSRLGTAKSMALAAQGLAEAFDDLQPDIVVILGDRYEILGAAQAALILQIPIAHICGGDITEGAFDDSIRHAITKMSHLHFVSHDGARERVIQMGENPDHVFNFGSPGLDYIANLAVLSREDVQKRLNFRLREQNILVTFHPVTTGTLSSQDQVVELLLALENFYGSGDGSGDDSGRDAVGMIFTCPNSDPEGRAMTKAVKTFVDKHDNAALYQSLGSDLYLNVVKQMSAVVGNSSSGLYEAPAMKIASVNIGERQEGRPLADSVISVPANSEEIQSAIRRAFMLDCSGTVSPYGEGGASAKIKQVIKEFPHLNQLLKKHFCSVNQTTRIKAKAGKK